MNDLVCPTCGKDFSTKQRLQYHMSKSVCVNKDFKCKYCFSTFTSRNAMNRHMRLYCKYKDELDKDLDFDKKEILEKFAELQASFAASQASFAASQETLPRLLAQIDELKKENNQLKSQTPGTVSTINDSSSNNTNTTINGDSANVNNGVVNNIYLMGYGNEDMGRIDRNELIKAFSSGFNSTLKLTETMHFNPKYPEYHNIYISSMKNQYAMVYDGTDWNVVMKDELVDRLYNNKRDYIEENLDEFIGSLSASQIDALHRWLEVDDEHTYVKKIKNDIRLLLYNKRFMAIDNKYNKSSTKHGSIDTQVQEYDNIMDNENKKVIKTPKHIDEKDFELIDSNTVPRRSNGSFRKYLEKMKDEERAAKTEPVKAVVRLAGRPGTKRKTPKFN